MFSIMKTEIVLVQKRSIMDMLRQRLYLVKFRFIDYFGFESDSLLVSNLIQIVLTLYFLVESMESIFGDSRSKLSM